MTATLEVQSAMPRRQRRYGLARWWLAGLLVSCLLPASLSPTDAFRGGDRSITICLWVPAILRAQSHWVAKRQRALRRWAQRPQRFAPVRLLSSWFVPMTLRVAARDVLTQRGPPSH
jgi:hypothetical protein